MATKRLPRGTRHRQKGTSLLLFTLLVTLLILPLLGLAIDGAIVFWVRAKLSAAVDAAALAGARSINVYEAHAVNTGTAVTVAQEWFSANYIPSVGSVPRAPRFAQHHRSGNSDCNEMLAVILSTFPACVAQLCPVTSA